MPCHLSFFASIMSNPRLRKWSIEKWHTMRLIHVQTWSIFIFRYQIFVYSNDLQALTGVIFF